MEAHGDVRPPDKKKKEKIGLRSRYETISPKTENKFRFISTGPEREGLASSCAIMWTISSRPSSKNNENQECKPGVGEEHLAASRRKRPAACLKSSVERNGEGERPGRENAKASAAQIDEVRGGLRADFMSEKNVYVT